MADSSTVPQLPDAISDAQLLLSYAARHGIALPDELVKTIVKSKAYLTANPTPDEEAEFWQKLTALTKAVDPVSVESLRASAKQLPDESLWNRIGVRIGGEAKTITYAGSAVRRFRVWTLLALIVLLVSQIFWVVGHTVVKETGTLLERQKTLKTDLQTLQRKLGDKAAESADVQKIEADIANTDTELKSAYSVLRFWNDYWRRALYISHPRPDTATYTELLDEQRVGGFALQALQLYLLPLIYGLLGACLYILRSLASEIAVLSYTRTSDIKYRLRLYMGSLAGMIIVWFLPSDGKSTDFQMLSSLSPLALAFLGGYSVEVLFALMDRFVQAFSSSADAKPRQ
jgi:hypothetical protein